MVRNLSDAAALPGYIEPPSKLSEGSEDEDLEDEDYEPPINDLDTGALVNELMKRDLLPREDDLKPHEQGYAATVPRASLGSSLHCLRRSQRRCKKVLIVELSWF
jgi:hypothetical protein